MMTLEIDDETASVLSDLAQQQHLNPGKIVKAALLDYIENRLDVQRAELAYQRYPNTAAKLPIIQMT